MINVQLGSKQEEKPFPKLMKSRDGYIVLFDEASRGVCVYTISKSLIEVGEFINNWFMEEFTDYNEPVTLQNA